MEQLEYLKSNTQILIDFIEEQQGNNISILDIKSISENSETSLAVTVSFNDNHSNHENRDTFNVSVYDLMVFFYNRVV
jgi:hypothetical protein